VLDIKPDIPKQINTNEKLLQEFDGNNLKMEVSGGVNSNTNGVSLEDKILAVAKESVEQVAMVQLFHGNVATPLDNEVVKQKKGWLFRFVLDPEVEPTNNRAERTLRPSVIYRKVSGGTRSSRGTKAYDTLFSIFYTQKLRKRNFIRDVPQLITRKEIHPG
jgi:hypothetical protein